MSPLPRWRPFRRAYDVVADRAVPGADEHAPADVLGNRIYFDACDPRSRASLVVSW